MSIAVYTHQSCLDHDPGPGHPESPARLAAVLEALDNPRFATLQRREAPQATPTQIARVHADALITRVLEEAPAQGWRRLDPDTVMSSASADAALRAAGAVCAAVDEVIVGPRNRAFCAVRPPGHHATHDTAMGFCLFNSIAIGAAHAIAGHGIERVAIVDFDVHHGNGTQDIFWSDPTVMYCSTHQMPLFPGTGAKGERGDHDTIVNAPLASEDGGPEFRSAFENLILPQLEKFSPELLIISAGFDAHYRDPLASLNLRAEDYTWVTRKLMDLADKSAGGRIVSVLEGGYDLQGLKESVTAHVGALMGA